MYARDVGRTRQCHGCVPTVRLGQTRLLQSGVHLPQLVEIEFHRRTIPLGSCLLNRWPPDPG